MLQAAGYQAILHGHTGGIPVAHPGRGGAAPSSTAPPGKGHSRPSPMSTGSRGPPRRSI